MSELLNPVLYRNLERLFGAVRVSNEGMATVSCYVESQLTHKPEMQMDLKGEQYRVCCDLCNDTRFRLYINHIWGRKDDVTGRRNLHLLYCHNQNCYSNYDAREWLYERLSGLANTLAKASIRPGKVQPKAAEVDPPGEITPLDDLPPWHPANSYLAKRFYDPAKLSRFYKVGFCRDSYLYLARGRIYIPLYGGDKLLGWQMRYVGDVVPEKQPKYWSCPGMLRGQVVYNIDNARKYRTGVLMEGPMKVFTLGPMGMASLGFPITLMQQKLVVPYFSEHSLVLLCDPDVQSTPEKRKQYHAIVASLASANFQHGFAAVVPPDQPDNLERGYLRRFIEKEALAQGVKVSWERR